jgi:hypothetical protein
VQQHTITETPPEPCTCDAWGACAQCERVMVGPTPRVTHSNPAIIHWRGLHWHTYCALQAAATELAPESHEQLVQVSAFYEHADRSLTLKSLSARIDALVDHVKLLEGRIRRKRGAV